MPRVHAHPSENSFSDEAAAATPTHPVEKIARKGLWRRAFGAMAEARTRQAERLLPNLPSQAGRRLADHSPSAHSLDGDARISALTLRPEDNA